MKNDKTDCFFKACQVVAGGVNSPVRAWKSVGRNPVFVHRAKGSKIYDVSGKEYVWVARNGGIIRIDVKEIKIEHFDQLGFTPIAMAFDGIHIWIVHNGYGYHSSDPI